MDLQTPVDRSLSGSNHRIYTSIAATAGRTNYDVVAFNCCLVARTHQVSTVELRSKGFQCS